MNELILLTALFITNFIKVLRNINNLYFEYKYKKFKTSKISTK